ncbi:MAG: SusD/RagB family nutrient-binding outer membrane lipoprotein [Cytophagales bacterium]|nr:SusD/RagB family nutrient-binding outer membrane lipoprotein [Cytophagales bacterium]
MKKFVINIMFAGVALGYTSCTDNFLEYNTNPYEATKEQMEYDNYHVQSAMLNMQHVVVPAENNLNQFAECLLGGSYGGYISDSNGGFVGRNFATYSADQGWSSVPFVTQIERFYPSYIQLKDVTEDPVLLSVGEILKVAVFHRITDIYGHIPYSKISKDGKLVAPFDLQQDVYRKMFKELDESIATLTANKESNFSSKADRVFEGNVGKWIKFANSLKLRLALRLSYADAALAQEKAEEAVSHEFGVITLNVDNAYYPVPKSPFRVVMYDYNGGDSRVSADITTYMNSYGDSRREKYFVKSSFSASIPEVEDGFHGLRSGINFSSSEEAQMYCNMNVGDSKERILWMNAAESAFLKAEGALRGWNMGGTPDEFYEKGVRLSFEQWEAAGVDEYLNNTDLPQPYVDPMDKNSYAGETSKISVKWNSSGDFEENLERIITQKWIANFPLGLEAWAEFRRTNYPKLMPAPHNLSNGVIGDNEFARRLPYPEREYQENRANLQKALDNLNGPDNQATKVWWDCKPKK